MASILIQQAHDRSVIHMLQDIDEDLRVHSPDRLSTAHRYTTNAALAN